MHRSPRDSDLEPNCQGGQLTYEADPRHSDLLLASLSMTECTGAATPGVKPLDRDEHAIKTDEPQTPTLDPDPNKAIASICSTEDEPAAQQYVDSLKDTNAYDLYQDGGARGKTGVRDNSNVTVTANAAGPLKSNPILKSKLNVGAKSDFTIVHGE